MTVTEFDHFKNIALGGLDWDSATLKLALLTTAYTPATTATAYGELTGEVADASYTAGGNALTGVAIADGAVTASPVEWASLTASFRYAVLYASGVVAGVTNPLLLLYDFGTEITVAALPWSLSWQGSTVYQLTDPTP